MGHRPLWSKWYCMSTIDDKEASGTSPLTLLSSLLPQMPALALGIPAFCAVFGHNAVGDGKAVGPAIYLVLFAIYHYLSSKEEDKAKKA